MRDLILTIPENSRYSATVQALREAIITCKLQPGMRLVQDELAAQLGTSRIPLREALRTLAAEGLVIIEANRGAIVAPIKAADVANLYDFRLALEQVGAREAASRFADLRAETKERRVLAERAIRKRDLPMLLRLDRDNHASLASMAGNSYLSRSLQQHWSEIMRLMYYYLTYETYPAHVWDEHEAIAAAVAMGDGEHAARLLESHIMNSRASILAHLRGASL